MQSLEKLHRAQRHAGQRDQREARRHPPALRVAPQFRGGVQGAGHARVENVLRMAREDLHRQRAAPEEQPGKRPPRKPAVDGEQDDRSPNHRAQIRQVTGEDVREIRPAEHEEHSGQHGGDHVQPTVAHPEVHEPAREKNVQRDADVDGEPQRQPEVEPVRRIEQRRLESAEILGAAVNVRVPQREVSAGHLAETEGAPMDELTLQVLGILADDLVGGTDQAGQKNGEREPEKKCRHEAGLAVGPLDPAHPSS